jgi:hypothetical protein
MFVPPEYATINCGIGCTFNGITLRANGSTGPISVPSGSAVSLLASKNSGSGCTLLLCSFFDNGSPIPSNGLNSTSYAFSTLGTHIVAAGCECSPCDVFGDDIVTVNVTPCTESPALNPPANFTAPSFSYSTVVAGPNGENWGNTNIQYSDANLSCAQICRNGGPAYRIEGDFSLTTSSITIRTQVPANGTCSAVARTAANISHTEGHELTHANALLGVINSWKSQIGTEYSGLAACQAALSSLKSIVAQAYTQEVSDQQNHVDHAGERRHAAVCPTANGSAAEVVCGLGGWNCSPSNTY